LVHLILFLDFTTYSYIYWTNGSSWCFGNWKIHDVVPSK
jgi:hypothetical protein